MPFVHISTRAVILQRRNHWLHKYHSKTKLFWAQRSRINVSFSSDYPGMSSKRCMRYNVIFWEQLFIRIFNIHFSFARWYNYDVSTCINGPPYAVSRVKYLCGSTAWSNINKLHILSVFYLQMHGSMQSSHHDHLQLNNTVAKCVNLNVAILL